MAKLFKDKYNEILHFSDAFIKLLNNTKKLKITKNFVRVTKSKIS